jgi:hypothetical protein
VTVCNTSSHGTKSQKTPIIDIAIKASQRTVFFGHKLHPSTERLSDIDSMVTPLWNLLTMRNLEDEDNTFSETSVRTRASRYEDLKGIHNI